MHIDEIAPHAALTGLEPNQVVTVLFVNPIGANALQVVYKLPTGELRERLLTPPEAAALAPARTRSWAFDGNPADFLLAVEAKRMDLAFLFDPMMAVHTSNVDPLPHQITAVYEAMLPRQPLRFILADDPGAGKTVMAGLYMRELLLRADARRILVLAPGSLVEQWQAELREKFGLTFLIYGRELDATSPTGDPLAEHDLLIVRLDQAARNPELRSRLAAAGWDLVVCDEAHKLSAHFSGDKTEYTQRFLLAKELGEHTRHLLLMTATPHNGKEEDFQLFLSLLDADRFYGKLRVPAGPGDKQESSGQGGARSTNSSGNPSSRPNGKPPERTDTGDLMRRMVKEELVTFDGSPLFPPRFAYTVNYTLSPLEWELYAAVTHYVKTEMGKVNELTGARKGSVGFALTTLQRRLASSPEAIHQSLVRRRSQLERRLAGAESPASAWDSAGDGGEIDEDDLDAAEQEELEEALVDQATAARTKEELRQEIAALHELERQATAVLASGQDRKWEELSQLLQADPILRDPAGGELGSHTLHKLIIFSEHRDTLNYLLRRIAGVLGDPGAIVTIHGGTPRKARREIQERFRWDPQVRVLVATDAAGEGVNLHDNAHLMVNYDLPWNPNRLEQRFGRIHRIGQRHTCHVWNVVAKETREGAVYHRLLQKLATERGALDGRVFDILGELFEDRPLKELLLEAILHGDEPQRGAQVARQMDGMLAQERVTAILERNALAQETMSLARLYQVKGELEKAEARKLQPYFVRTYFLRAFGSFGGKIHGREPGRYEISFVPWAILERDRQLRGRKGRSLAPVVNKYGRVCFAKEAIQPPDRPGVQAAALLHPGHPLLLAMTDLLLEKHGSLLREGAILVDPADEGSTPHLLFLLAHELRDGTGRAISQRLQFVRVAPDGSAVFGGYAPHLDLEPLDPADRPHLAPLLAEPWLSRDLEQQALALAAATLAPEHAAEVGVRRAAEVEKTRQAVHMRLTREIDYWTERYLALKEAKEAGKPVVPATLDNFRRTVQELEARLASRKAELDVQGQVYSATPVVLGGALVVPQGLVAARRLGAAEAAGEGMRPGVRPGLFAADPAARARIERAAMDAVRRYEEGRGCVVEDVSAAKCGWDLTAQPPLVDGRLPRPRHIEVKGRVVGADTVTVTRSEIAYGLNQGDKFVLAVVLVGEDGQAASLHYIERPFETAFETEPPVDVASINFDLKALLAKGEQVR